MALGSGGSPMTLKGTYRGSRGSLYSDSSSVLRRAPTDLLDFRYIEMDELACGAERCNRYRDSVNRR
jgi:hypothetical protein